MKKLFFIFCMVFLSVLQGFSQFHAGLRGGINTTYFEETQVTSGDLRITVPKGSSMGYHFGVVTQLNVFDFFVQPELLVSWNKNDIIIREGNVDSLDIHSFNQLHLPVILGYKFGALKFEAGPVGSLLINSKTDLLDEKGIEQNLKTMTFGYQVGLGLEVGKLTLDLKYEGNLGKFGEGLNINGTDINFDQRVNQLVFSIGLFIL